MKQDRNKGNALATNADLYAAVDAALDRAADQMREALDIELGLQEVLLSSLGVDEIRDQLDIEAGLQQVILLGEMERRQAGSVTDQNLALDYEQPFSDQLSEADQRTVDASNIAHAPSSLPSSSSNAVMAGYFAGNARPLAAGIPSPPPSRIKSFISKFRSTHPRVRTAAALLILVENVIAALREPLDAKITPHIDTRYRDEIAHTYNVQISWLIEYSRFEHWFNLYNQIHVGVGPRAGTNRRMEHRNTVYIAGDLEGIPFALINTYAATVWSADLSRACFSHSTLVRADFREADLRRADFRNATLINCVLGSRINGMDVRGADMRTVKLFVDDLDGVIWDSETKWSRRVKEALDKVSTRAGDGVFVASLPPDSTTAGALAGNRSR